MNTTLRRTPSIFRLLASLLVIGLLLGACTPEATNSPGSTESTGESVPNTSSTTIKVGSKDFTEEFIVAEMYAHLLEHAGFTVERKLNLGGTPIAHAALVQGDIDLYPEYTSTGLLTVLKQQQMQGATEIYNTVKEGYEQQFQVTWLDPSPFNNTQALAMTRANAEQFGISTYSDLAQAAPELILGGPAEFLEREDGIKGLQGAYGGFQFKETRQLGTGSLRYQALQDGQVDVVVAFGTDGQIDGMDLALIEDDQGFYPVYNIAPVVRMDTLQNNPEIADALNRLAPLLTDQVMSGLNWQVDGPDKREPADVARDFLTQNGLLE